MHVKQSSTDFDIKEEHFFPAFQELIKTSEKEIDEIVENKEDATSFLKELIKKVEKSI